MVGETPSVVWYGEIAGILRPKAGLRMTLLGRAGMGIAGFSDQADLRRKAAEASASSVKALQAKAKKSPCPV